jgi:mono/diheme cytochrome c family protein
MIRTNPRNAGTASLIALGIVVLASAGRLAAQAVSPPEAITLERVAEGLRLYHTKGACSPCHGEFGIGTADGPELVTGQWKLGPGNYEWLRHITRHAGWGATQRDADPQPMRGPTVLDSAEVSAVAAYVWTISRGRVVAGGPR